MTATLPLVFCIAILSQIPQAINAQSESGEAPVQVVCPVDGNSITYTLKQPPRGHLIEDRDFCLRVVPEITSFRTISIYPARLAVCPKCGLAAPPDSQVWNAGSEFAKWYSEKFPGALAGGARAVKPSWELFERYALALEFIGADEREVALAWLDAAFCMRTGFWEEHQAWNETSTRAVVELADATPLDVPYPAPRVLYEESIEIPSYFHDLLFNPRRAGPALGVLSGYWLARGETARVQNSINALLEIETAVDSKLSGSGPKLVNDISASGLTEKMRVYQENAAVNFELALDIGQITASEVPLVYYHLGELYRRAGELKKAERYYKLAHAHHAATEKIKERSHSGLEILFQDEVLFEELIAFVTADFIDEIPVSSVADEIEEIEPVQEEEIEPQYFVGEAIEIGKRKK